MFPCKRPAPSHIFSPCHPSVPILPPSCCHHHEEWGFAGQHVWRFEGLCCSLPHCPTLFLPLPLPFSNLQEECQKYGTMVKLTIPRPTAEQPHPMGLGLIMIEYTDLAAALKAKQAMHGRKFGGHTVEGTFLSETDYITGNFHSTAA